MNLLELNLEQLGSKKIALQGETNRFPTYKVPINKLKYNQKNGRIATYVSEYMETHTAFPKNNIEEFNQIIERYIEDSNPTALEKTKKNIEKLGQTEPAVILSSGVVLDGNRRFTSLRQLCREGKSMGGKFDYIEAVILDENKYNEKDIKRLELNLQHGMESRVDYNPIDRLVDIYRDLIKSDCEFTPEEYAAEIQVKVAKVKEEIEVAKLMLEYLEFIKQPLKFHIARQQQIDGPIREVWRILKSPSIDPDDRDTIRDYLFATMSTCSSNLKATLRDLAKVFKDKNLSAKFLNKIEETEILDDLEENLEENKEKNLEENKEKNKQSINKVSEGADVTDVVTPPSKEQAVVRKAESVKIDKTLADKVNSMTENIIETKKLSNAKNEPIKLLNKAIKALSEVDQDSVERFDASLIEDYIEKIDIIIEKANEAKAYLN